jgi:hypothetical protein
MLARKMKAEELLFQNYSKNLAYYVPQLAGFFVCPLCLRGFDREDLKKGVLTKEHIVPSSMGGRTLTLTCAQCNHTHGSNLDAHLHRRMNMKDVFQGLASHVGTLTVGDSKMTTKFTMPNHRSVGKPAFVIVGIPAKSEPHAPTAVERALSAPSPQMMINYTFRTNVCNSKSALIRMAYLMMFHYFGYFYLRYSFTEGIRAIINNPEEGSPYYRGVNELPESPHNVNGLGVVHQPVSMRSFVVILRLQSAVARHYMVLLPGFVLPDPNVIYDNCKEIGKCNLEVSIIDYTKAFLTEEKYVDFPLNYSGG